jgi:glycosyl hydrolase family 26
VTQPSGRHSGGPGRPRPRRRGLLHGPVTVLITGLAIAAVAGATVAVVEVAAPNVPAPPSTQVAAGQATIGAFSAHPVRITVPATPDSYLGAYADGVPHSYAPVRRFAGVAGARPDLALYYSGWGQPFQTRFADSAVADGAIPLVQIEPGTASLAAIAVGGYDRYLEEFATQVASFGARTGHGVVIGFAHEPNGTWYPWGREHTRPATWIAAWRHVVTVFRQQGADDVAWLWTVNIIDRRSGIASPTPWWPGASYVSWIGIDGYYYKPSWTFASLFGPTIRAVRALSLDPVLIAETAAAPAAGQTAKVTNLFAGVHNYGLLGFVWFNADRRRDWRLTGTAATAAFRRGANTFSRPAS